MIKQKLQKILGATLCGMLLAMPSARADSSPPGGAEIASDAGWSFKLTPSYYNTTHEKEAADVNLRANNGPHAVWLGYYRRGSEFEQTRTGYEYTAEYSIVQVVPSLQLASHGFAGGSLNTRIGDQVYALLGYGRTNAKDYYNLNFDPNDSFVFGLGSRLLPKSDLSLFTVRDNRLHTGQQVTHFVWRWTPGSGERWTLDLSAKHGRPSPDESAVSGDAISLTYDHKAVFIRLAYDRKVNFSNDDQTRLSLGLRF